MKWEVWLVQQWPGQPPVYTKYAAGEMRDGRCTQEWTPYLLVHHPVESEARDGRIKWWLEGRAHDD